MLAMALIGVPVIAGVLLERRGYRPLGMALLGVGYAAAAVWAVAGGDPIFLIALIGAPMPGLHQRAVARGERGLAIATDVVFYGVLVVIAAIVIL